MSNPHSSQHTKKEPGIFEVKSLLNLSPPSMLGVISLMVLFIALLIYFVVIYPPAAPVIVATLLSFFSTIITRSSRVEARKSKAQDLRRLQELEREEQEHLRRLEQEFKGKE